MEESENLSSQARLGVLYAIVRRFCAARGRVKLLDDDHDDHFVWTSLDAYKCMNTRVGEQRVCARCVYRAGNSYEEEDGW